MSWIRSNPVARLLHHLATSDLSPSPERVAAWDLFLKIGQPGFRTAVLEDTRLTAFYRSERSEFRSGFEAAAQAMRLAFVTDSFLAQVAYRAEVVCRVRHLPFLPSLLHRVSVMSGQVNIGPFVIIDPGLYLPHGQVVIDGLTSVRSGAAIRPFVTLGLIDGEPYGPVVGARVQIGTGAKVLGPIRIGDGAQIGANAVVRADVPARTTVVGVPARPIRSTADLD